MKDLKLIKGAGRSYYIDECPDIKWSQKDFKEKYNDNAKLRKAFNRLVADNLANIIPENIIQDINITPPDGIYAEEMLEWNEDLQCYVDSKGNQYDDEGNLLEDPYDDEGNLLEE